MKIFVTGTRGIPYVPGGIETHCQHLYANLSKNSDFEIVISVRNKYCKVKQSNWKGVNIINTFAPSSLHLETIFHTFLSIIKAKLLKADMVHIHAVGPALLVPVARIMGLTVIFTHHGPDYEKKKWGKLSKLFLQIGEYLGCLFANEMIVISKTIENLVLTKYKKPATVIYNGAAIPNKHKGRSFLDSVDLEPDSYVLTVARFVPEKGLELLVRAFQQCNTKFKLVVVGDSEYETTYSKQLKAMIDSDDNIIRTGYITGEPLHQLFSHARLFVMPSFHEGLPIALLEAMGYGRSVLVSDIPANLEVGLRKDRYFTCGDVEDLKEKMERLLEVGISDGEKNDFISRIKEKYNWEKIAAQTIKVYEQALKKR